MPVDTVSQAASLEAITAQTPGIRTLRLKTPVAYKPGQSIQITFPGDPKKRFYSISSSPTEGAFIDITIKSEAGSALDMALAGLKPGAMLEIAGPMGGALSLPDAPEESVAFLAAGTGVTPFRSMIRYLIDRQWTSEFWLFHSVRAQTDLLFYSEFSAWASAHRHFHYVPTITRDFDATWTRETGRLSDAVIRKHLTATPCTYLLCGPAGFVTDMEQTLWHKLHIPPEQVRREKW